MHIQVTIPFQLAMWKMGTYYAESTRETLITTLKTSFPNHAKAATAYNSQEVGTRDH